MSGQEPGHVNFILEASLEDHPYKFRMIINETSLTFPTGCVAPYTGLAQALTYGAIGHSQARITIQASDCTQTQDEWLPINGYFDYSSEYWFDIHVNMIEHSFHD